MNRKEFASRLTKHFGVRVSFEERQYDDEEVICLASNNYISPEDITFISERWKTINSVSDGAYQSVEVRYPGSHENPHLVTFPHQVTLTRKDRMAGWFRAFEPDEDVYLTDPPYLIGEVRDWVFENVRGRFNIIETDQPNFCVCFENKSEALMFKMKFS